MGAPVQRAAQRADERLDRADRTGRRLQPQVGHQPADRDDLAARHQQAGDDCPVARTAQVERPALAVAGDERPEHLERHFWRAVPHACRPYRR